MDEADVRWPDNVGLNKMHYLNALEDNSNIRMKLNFLKSAKKSRWWVGFFWGGRRWGRFTKC